MKKRRDSNKWKSRQISWNSGRENQRVATRLTPRQTQSKAPPSLTSEAALRATRTRSCLATNSSKTVLITRRPRPKKRRRRGERRSRAKVREINCTPGWNNNSSFYFIAAMSKPRSRTKLKTTITSRNCRSTISSWIMSRHSYLRITILLGSKRRAINRCSWIRSKQPWTSSKKSTRCFCQPSAKASKRQEILCMSKRKLAGTYSSRMISSFKPPTLPRHFFEQIIRTTSPLQRTSTSKMTICKTCSRPISNSCGCLSTKPIASEKAFTYRIWTNWW